MSRNGAVTPDWQFTVEVQEGETITYKYVKGGSWDQEGLADHTREDDNDDDVSYYGYGAIGTDLKVTVHNEGNNTMIVQDRILRWIDMPVVIEEVQKQGSQVTIKGNAIKNGVLTINGERVPIDGRMAFSYTFTPASHQKEVSIHIEPSAESKTAIFNNDGGAIAKNTKDYVLNLETKQLREGKLTTPPSNGDSPESDWPGSETPSHDGGATPGNGTSPGSGGPSDGTSPGGSVPPGGTAPPGNGAPPSAPPQKPSPSKPKEKPRKPTTPPGQVKKVYWDGVELKKGQIGRLTVQKPINLWKRAKDGRLVFVRILQPGEVYRVYGYDARFGGQYAVGGGYYVTDIDTHIRYETPSKEKLKLVNGE
ncbi:Maltodextrin glucosidase [Geobacillus stearothermophilus]|uniref:Maltodextrin glucosidase n=1 Tax=Geobacillus stearothermophilus TaxID=1422 RepID=A0ABQ7HBV8_GEOSE|nr:Maltodextrin glucosidase [Geobacillus stearothermophilus]